MVAVAKFVFHRKNFIAVVLLSHRKTVVLKMKVKFYAVYFLKPLNPFSKVDANFRS